MANKRKTHEEFVAKVRLYTDEDIEFLNKYETKRSEMKIKCNTCGHKWSIRQANIFSAFKRNKDYILCPECRKQLELKNLQEKFKNKFYELLGDEYELLSEYKDDKEKITVKHNVCGRIYDVRASSMFGKEQTRCKRCSDKKRAEKLSWSPELFEEKFYDKFSPEEFKIITKYSTKRENIVIKHLQCGHEWEAKPPDLLRMKGDNPCPLCRVNWNKKTQEEFELQVFDAVKDEYSVLGEYGGHNEKVLMIHNYCGHKWDVSPSNFIHNNSRCPKCSGNKSFPEQALYYYLSKKFPSVINSYSPEWIGKSEIDIFIPELNIGIEYDGVYYHKGKSKLNVDLRKNELIKSKNIYLIRIREKGCPQMKSSEGLSIIEYDVKHNYSNFQELWNYLSIELYENSKEIKKEILKETLDNTLVSIEDDRIKILEKAVSAIKEKSIAVTHPKVASEWNYLKNGTLKPEYFTAGSQQKVWWICECGNEWDAIIRNRTANNSRCPKCSESFASQRTKDARAKKRGCYLEDLPILVNNMLDEGKTRKEIAEFFGYKKITTLTTALKKQGYSLSRETKRYEIVNYDWKVMSDSELVDQVNKSIGEGLLFKDIALMYNYTEASFIQILNKKGYKKNKKTGLYLKELTTEELVHKVNELLNSGLTLNEVALELDYASFSSLSNTLVRRGYYKNQKYNRYEKQDKEDIGEKYKKFKHSEEISLTEVVESVNTLLKEGRNMNEVSHILQYPNKDTLLRYLNKNGYYMHLRHKYFSKEKYKEDLPELVSKVNMIIKDKTLDLVANELGYTTGSNLSRILRNGGYILNKKTRQYELENENI